MTSHESDPGPYPVPLGTPIEGGRKRKGDRHVLTVSNGFMTGAADKRWDDDVLGELKDVPSSRFEVLDWDQDDLVTENDC